MNKKLSIFSLAMLIIAAIDSIRNLPMAALFGSSLIFFFLLAAILFLFPVALVSAQLTSTYQDKGGIYHWVNLAFGHRFAMLAIWLQWINTMIWYPTILSFLAGSIAYLIDPALANHQAYMAAMIVMLFWILTLLSFKGIHFSAKISSILATFGTVIPLFLVIILGAIWVISGQSIPIKFSFTQMLPHFTSMDNFVSLTAIMASYLGMELAGVHINDVKNPQKNFPKVLLFSASFILFTMLFGSLSIALVIPEKEISLVSGVLQYFSAIFDQFHLANLIPLVVLSIVIGGIGGMFNWLTSPAKGLLHAAEFGYLPACFTKQNSKAVPVNIMLLQGLIVTLTCFLFLFVPSVNAFYWFLTVLSTNLYMLMYVLLFLSAMKLNRKEAFKNASFKISKSPKGLTVTAMIGLLGCMVTIFVGFFPAPELQIENKLGYFLAMLFGMISMSALSGLFFFYKERFNSKL